MKLRLLLAALVLAASAACSADVTAPAAPRKTVTQPAALDTSTPPPPAYDGGGLMGNGN
ncbi:MAG TPA: hypothetical protein VFE05_14770 [Longimicrobiaceae bacterium]|jgi:hypothetical protein|nr:hypothetical protein [Longimicrobiaceae bacterium]